ncbi:MAG: tetratricopeptide repeat protein [Terracidiphilus sp.]
MTWCMQAQSNAAPQSPPSSAAPSSGAQKPQANPFPDDTNTVPVLPSNDASSPPADDSYGGALPPMPGADGDPVKSPDDASSSAEGSDASSSSAGLDNLLKPPPDEDKGKHRKHDETEATHTESAKEDESVGSYYLSQKNWRAALSRFESALVLDPENPDVYWGLAESQRNLGSYGSAKANYLKVMEYDPESKHSKDAQKYLKDPDLARAKAMSTASDAAPQAPQ